MQPPAAKHTKHLSYAETEIQQSTQDWFQSNSRERLPHSNITSVSAQKAFTPLSHCPSRAMNNRQTS